MIAVLLLAGIAASDPVAGTWEGTSLCQVKSSPCRDEHVLYRFSPVQPRRYRADAYKLVAGAEVFMGPIDVVFDPASGALDGAVTSGGPQALGRLRLMVRGAHLTGKMTLADGSLYRLIEADKR